VVFSVGCDPNGAGARLAKLGKAASSASNSPTRSPNGTERASATRSARGCAPSVDSRKGEPIIETTNGMPARGLRNAQLWRSESGLRP
jgi:hypothetical protein